MIECYQFRCENAVSVIHWSTLCYLTHEDAPYWLALLCALWKLCVKGVQNICDGIYRLLLWRKRMGLNFPTNPIDSGSESPLHIGCWVQGRKTCNYHVVMGFYLAARPRKTKHYEVSLFLKYSLFIFMYLLKNLSQEISQKKSLERNLSKEILQKESLKRNLTKKNLSK